MDRIHPLRLWRQQHRITLADLASRRDVGVSPAHLSEIERGVNGCSLDLAARLSRVTGGRVKVEDFVMRADA